MKALRLWSLAEYVWCVQLPQELLDPSTLVEHAFNDQFGEQLRIKGACIAGERRGAASLHLDAVSNSGEVTRVMEHHRELVMDRILNQTNASELCPSEDIDKWEAIEVFRHWRYGHHPAVICQVDSMLSIAEEICSGRFVHSIFTALYADESIPLDHFTFRGIAIGAGLHDNISTDPMQLWAASYGEIVLLIDSNQSRLQTAVEALKVAHRVGFRNAVITPICAEVTPQALEFRHDPLHSTIHHSLEASGREPLNSIDVLQIDIDSFDCAVLNVLVKQFEASLIIIESQPLAPPPIKFARMWQPENRDGFCGCSLSYQLRLLHPTYRLLVYTEDDTIFVHSRLTKPLETLSAKLAGSVIPWTTYPLKFPIDEMDCYRRSRMLPFVARRVKKNESFTNPSVETLREWALKLHPRETLTKMWDYLMSAQDNSAGIPPYSLDF